MKNTNFSVPLQDNFKQIQNSVTETNISDGDQFILHLLFSCHHAVAIFIKKKKKQRNNRGFIAEI